MSSHDDNGSNSEGSPNGDSHRNRKPDCNSDRGDHEHADDNLTLAPDETSSFDTAPQTPNPSTATDRATHPGAPERASESEPLQPGRVIGGRYRLNAFLGKGGNGEVWTARDAITHEEVALKSLLSVAGSVLSRIRSEIATLRRLRMPGVVRLLDEGIEGDRPFLVMERVCGRPFPGSIAPSPSSPPRFSWSDIAEPTFSLLEVLSRMHSAGVVHRDLKPDNVLVSDDGRTTVLDLGASLWNRGGSYRPPTAGQLVGTPRYISPEQILEQPCDARADLYAVGVILYELLTGQKPHPAPNTQSLYIARLRDTPKPVREIGPDIPEPVADVVDRLLKTRMEDRPRSASEALFALRRETQEPIRATTGPIVRALSPTRHGARFTKIPGDKPIDEASLRPLFEGPDRLFHLREDAARLLWERTKGVPARIETELTLWVRLGLARWDGDHIALDREAIGQLSADARGTRSTASSPPTGAGADPLGNDILRWLALGGHDIELHQLAQAMGKPVSELEPACRALVARAAVWLEEGRLAPCIHVDITWPPARRREAHKAIADALRPEQDGRLFHLLSAERPHEAATEAIATARRRAREGDLDAATTALGDALRAVQEGGGATAADDEQRLLEECVKVAFAEETPIALDRTHYDLVRARGRGPSVMRLEALMRAAIKASGASSPEALKLADEIGPFDDPELERRRQWVRIRAASARASSRMLDAVLNDVAAWLVRTGEPLAELTLLEGRAVSRYIQGHFTEAATFRAEAAQREPWLTGRIAATFKCGSALLEDFRHEEATKEAAKAKVLAAACRLPYWEGKAEWLLRAALYRMAKTEAPDFELIDAVSRVGDDDLEGLVFLNEAAVAFRARDAQAAIDLATRAARTWQPMDRSGAVLARCLAIACGAQPREGEIEYLAARALRCELPGIGAQAVALLGRELPGAKSLWIDEIPRLTESVPREHWSKRMDVLSMDESIAWAVGR